LVIFFVNIVFIAVLWCSFISAIWKIYYISITLPESSSSFLNKRE